ncbi:MAG: DUF2252 domain-containing protein [Deltaproteobacteria bacterium]|nr:MAG: DUF2252 domain-containing protein [Deltaproteobacteria bacterium]
MTKLNNRLYFRRDVSAPRNRFPIEEMRSSSVNGVGENHEDGDAFTLGRSRNILSPDVSSPQRAGFVQDVLLDYHDGLIANNPLGAQAKFEKLKTSPFVFFRGTADLFYQGLAGSDESLPKVLCNGDVHPENFGVMEGPDGKLIFGLNDFDEAHEAPFTWDIKRGATGFLLAAREHGLGKKDSKAAVRSFAEGYLDKLQDLKEGRDDATDRLTAKNSPKLIEDLLESAEKESRKDFLEKRVDLDQGVFLETDEILPISDRVPDFQATMDAYRSHLSEHAPDADFFKVKDVAIKKGSGTGSVGLWRYYVLIEGSSDKHKNDIVLEFKQTRPSVMEGHVGFCLLDYQLGGERTVDAHLVQVEGGDRFYGHVDMDGESYLIRERNPHKAGVDLSKMDEDDFKDYAKVCGEVLAQAHARSDTLAGSVGKSSVERILRSLDVDAFAKDCVDDAVLLAEQMTQDYHHFCSEAEQGVFQFSEES